MHALILTNHFLEIGGSEMVAIDVAEVLDSMGYDVEIFCNAYSNEMLRHLKGEITVTDNINDIDINKYEFIWTQHGVIGLFLNNLIISKESKTIVSAHLSPFENHEHIGLMSALLTQAKIITNSEETKNFLNEYGVPAEQMYNFKNSAPRMYFSSNLKITDQIKSVAIISNHIPIELLEVVDLLQEAGVKVKIYGKNNDYTRIRLEHLEGVDAVITIGRSVQYALCAGKPVYCYDMWGGPGWLNLDNFASAEKFNFSGRCCNRKITTEEIFSEIISDFIKIRDSLKFLHDYAIENYCLENVLREIIASSVPDYSDVDYNKIIIKTSIDHSSLIRKIYRFGFLR
jgi:hypothetical protein